MFFGVRVRHASELFSQVIHYPFVLWTEVPVGNRQFFFRRPTWTEFYRSTFVESLLELRRAPVKVLHVVHPLALRLPATRPRAGNLVSPLLRLLLGFGQFCPNGVSFVLIAGWRGRFLRLRFFTDLWNCSFWNILTRWRRFHERFGVLQR